MNYIKAYRKDSLDPFITREIPTYENFGIFLKNFIEENGMKTTYQNKKTNVIDANKNTELDFTFFVINKLLEEEIIFDVSSLDFVQRAIEEVVEFFYEKNNKKIDTKKFKLAIVANEIEKLRKSNEGVQYVKIDINPIEIPSKKIFHFETFEKNKEISLLHATETKVFYESSFYKTKDVLFYNLLDDLEKDINDYKKIQDHLKKVQNFKKLLLSKKQEDNKLKIKSSSGGVLKKETFSKYSTPITEKLSEYEKKIFKEQAFIVEKNKKIYSTLEIKNFKNLISIYNDFKRASIKIKKMTQEKKEIEDFLEEDDLEGFAIQSIEGLTGREDEQENYIDIKKLEQDVKGFSELFKVETQKYKKHFDEVFNDKVFKIIHEEILDKEEKKS